VPQVGAHRRETGQTGDRIAEHQVGGVELLDPIAHLRRHLLEAVDHQLRLLDAAGRVLGRGEDQDGDQGSARDHGPMIHGTAALNRPYGVRRVSGRCVVARRRPR
jgi:hypothetical protein